MKIILTGTTGYIGTHTLMAALDSPSITSITALTRKPLSNTSPKLITILHTDFTDYPPSLLSRPEISQAEACIWSLGALNADRDVNYNFPLAFANAWLRKFGDGSSEGGGKRKMMRFVFLGGAIGEGDLVTRIMGKVAAVRLRVETVRALMELAREHGSWQTIVAKPGLVLDRGLSAEVTMAISGKDRAIYGDELGKALLELATDPGPRSRAKYTTAS